jgi:hypothetical protein
MAYPDYPPFDMFPPGPDFGYHAAEREEKDGGTRAEGRQQNPNRSSTMPSWLFTSLRGYRIDGCRAIWSLG